MAPIDWVIAAILVLSTISAAKNGFFIEAFSLGGVILGLLIASWNFQKLMPWIMHTIHTPQIAEAIAFLAIAFAIMILAGLLGRALHWSARSIGLGWLDRLIGAVFGFLKGCVVVTLGVMALAAFFPRNGWLDHSQLAPYFLTAAHSTTAITPVELGERIRDGVRIIRDVQPDWLKPHAEACAQVAAFG
ncbi:Colicin V production protein [Acidisarcina polymorpha]|uniref:Colicin V production protein n=1 Tax=Acidisarcina polymorpha TaxID=2211140 RepID=A0A2Z5FVZ9_9BACT|nr:CvpA family protein [Acidisarcina polymorpha]AXC10687.1 Colicin V production protein [Acidisarcina polymorpha]